MNIDELKNIWDNDTAENTPEVSLEQRKSLNLPLEKIRKNMRWEFWSTIILLAFVLVAIWGIEMPFRFRLYLDILVGSMTLVTLFFYHKFFKLYKEISNPELETLASLQDLLHQFHLNKQYYLSFYISFVPFIVAEMIIILESIPYTHQYSNLHLVCVFLGAVFAGLVFLWILGKFWFNYYYGKYIKKVEDLVKELRN
ncbi:hypothetical protein G6R40_04460 [Chryseobacterium sp. POL2]|uniref:hypothetical protein n=1 Tax=Chryseobacterium sp. POL2 TaxID=2713414 RepID=UPI0013E12059|nr:hypothetical protein [Chryseobacterium sp. POL2]QIG88966.1 hypothetical protein G6R40_04460 [Chryseobacterium sp. POL2]